MRLRELMTPDVVAIGPDVSADQAWSRMENNRIRHLVVQEGTDVVGVISDRDLGGPNGRAVRRGRTVGDLMSPKVIAAHPGMTLREAANMMRGRLVGSLPVLDRGRVVGIVTATDVLNELGRGSTRPAVRAERRSPRRPPARARDAKRMARRARTRPRKRAPRAPAGDRPDHAVGRYRERLPESLTREPFAAGIARPIKRTAGRSDAGLTPAHIRAVGSLLDPLDEEYIRRKLGRKLGKFARSIERVSVRVEDINGPRGGVDKRCAIKIVLAGLPSVVVEQHDPSLQRAMDLAIARAEQAVRNTLGRRRMQPRRGRRVRAFPGSDLDVMGR